MQPDLHAPSRNAARPRLRSSIQVLIASSLVSAVTLLTMPVAAAERPSDKDVKSLLERIYHERDRFEDQLDGKLKDSILRGPGGEVNVSRYLDDLQGNVNKAKDRFTPEYSASAEVTTVLRQGSDIQRFMANQPPNYDGASEWNRLWASLGELAAVYATSMPTADGQQARRMNDREVKGAAEELAKSADRFKKDLDTSLKGDKAIDKATREAVLREADALKEDAKRLGSTVGGGRPASGEAQALLDRAAKVRAASAGRTLLPAAQTSWTSVESSLNTVAQAFNLSTPRQ